MTDATAVIHAEGLTKIFGSVRTLDGLDLTVRPGPAPCRMRALPRSRPAAGRTAATRSAVPPARPIDGFVAATHFIAFLGSGLKFRQWIADLLPTTHVGNPPAGAIQIDALAELPGRHPRPHEVGTTTDLPAGIGGLGLPALTEEQVTADAADLQADLADLAGLVAGPWGLEELLTCVSWNLSLPGSRADGDELAQVADTLCGATVVSSG